MRRLVVMGALFMGVWLVAPGVGTHTDRIPLEGSWACGQQMLMAANREDSKTARNADPGTVKVDPKDGLKYAWIPPGAFMMGCSQGDTECGSNEKPPHQVRISKGFWMGQTEATVGAYKRFTTASGEPMPSAPTFNSGWANDKMPIVSVNWKEARDYCTWAGGRLPTEAEWEYATRGGNTGARFGPLDEVAWYASNSGQQRVDSERTWKEDQKNYGQMLKDNHNRAHSVAQKRANAFGLFDTLGNVWEWLNDWYDPSYYQNSPAQDPSGPTSGQFRVLRGGSWDNAPGLVRVSMRGRLGPSSRSNAIGFRCVAEMGSP